jgi:hypothetical protein
MGGKVKLDLHRGLAIFVFAAALIVYASSMATSESFWDCGEFAACSYTLGVPHPPGTPMFLLLGRIFSMLPLSSDIAVRVTWMSVLAAALAIMLAYLIIVRLLRMMRGPETTLLDKIINYGGAVVGALTLGWSYSMWFNSVESEVYASSQFFTHIVVWLILVWHEKADEPDNARWLLLIAYMMGLAIGVHLLNVLTIPALAMVVYFRRKKFAMGSFAGTLIATLAALIMVYPGIVKWLPLTASTISVWAPVVITLAVGALFWWSVKNRHGIIGVVAGSALLIIVGYSAMMEIYIRSGMNPGIDENDPDNPARFFSYLNREQYGDRPVFPRVWNNDPEYKSTSDYFWRYQVNKMFNRYLFWNFIGRQGAPHDEYQDAGVSPKYTVVSLFANEPTGGLRWLGIITCVPFLLGLIGFVRQFTKDKKGWFIVATIFFMTGYAIILYLNQDDPQPRERDYSYVGAFFAFTIWVGFGAAAVIEWAAKNLKKLPSPHYAAAGTAVLLLVLSPVIMLAQNYEMDKRTGNDVAADYAYNMLNACGPNGILFTNGDNDTFPVWYLQEVEGVRKDVRIVNLSLINTGWYILQMKHRDPKVPISFSDSYIDRYLDQHDRDALLSRYWPPEKQKVELNTPDGKMTWSMPATMFIPIKQDQSDRTNNFLRVQDIMILDILRTNYDPSKTPVPRPIYFAVTVANSNMIGLRDFLTMEGLVFRVNPKGRTPIDPEAIRKTVFDTMRGHLRGINNPSVHYDDNVEKLLQNYRSAYLQLAYFYSNQADSGSATSSQYPSLDQRIANFNKLTNRQKALTCMEEMDRAIPESVRPISNPDLSVQIGRMYADLGKPEELRHRLEMASARTDLRPESQMRLAAYWASNFNDNDRANKLMTSALGVNPTAEQCFAAGRECFSAGALNLAAQYFEKTLSLDPNSGQAIGALLQVYENMGNSAKAQMVLEDWINKHPTDKGAKQRLDQMRGVLATEPNAPKKSN